MIIKGFWHVFVVNHWYSIVADQLRVLISSGLYDASEQITLGIIGTDQQQLDYLQWMILNQYPKLRVGYVSHRPEDYEFRTLKLIEDDKGVYAGYYFHTKGVSDPADTIKAHWRAWLNEAVLNRWREHYEMILRGFDVSSVNHCQPPKHPEHFSGNFWWFNRKYINRLPAVDSLRWTHRYDAEQWICCGHGQYYAAEFVEPGRDVFEIKNLE